MSAMQLNASSFRGTSLSTRVGVALPRAGHVVVPVRAAQTLQGKVVSTHSDKTTVVQVDNVSIHPLYSKRVKRSKKYTAHNEKGECKIGDIVKLTPTRPLSKTKRFIVDEIVQKSTI